jgi:hypothetical protein
MPLQRQLTPPLYVVPPTLHLPDEQQGRESEFNQWFVHYQELAKDLPPLI